MKHLKIICTFIVMLSVLIFGALPVTNAKTTKNSFYLQANVDTKSQQPSKYVSFTYHVHSPNEKTLASFIFRIKFDNSLLSYKSIELSDNLKNNTVKLGSNNGILTIIALEKLSPIIFNKNTSTYLFTIKFAVNDYASTPSNTSIKSYFSSIIDYGFHFVKTPKSCRTRLAIKYPDKMDACLKRLIPNHGKLTPSFSPSITQYKMTVDSTVSSIVFNTLPINKNSTVRVNRKNLLGYNTDTDFQITSKTPDGSSQVYTVTVHRQDKPSSSSSHSSSKSSSSSKHSSSAIFSISSTGSNNKATPSDNDSQNNIILNNNSSKNFIVFLIFLGLAFILILLFILPLFFRKDDKQSVKGDNINTDDQK